MIYIMKYNEKQKFLKKYLFIIISLPLNYYSSRSQKGTFSLFLNDRYPVYCLQEYLPINIK